jgi:dihydrofolate reductase
MLKEAEGEDMAILGSGSIVSQLAAAGLIDGLQIAVHPLVLGGGKRLFAGVTAKFPMKLTETRQFGNGTVLLSYAPA